MSEPTPSPEAVEAALSEAERDNSGLTIEQCQNIFLVSQYWHRPSERVKAAARILAAEVRRMRNDFRIRKNQAI